MKKRATGIFMATALTTAMLMQTAAVSAESVTEAPEAVETEAADAAAAETADAAESTTETLENGVVIEYFQNPDCDSKPMARMWFPDAGAGEDDDDTIEKQILELADKGFGGVEVAMLADGVSYTNEEAKTYGWGTENWSKLLKKVFKAAAKVEGGFQVDCTITAHWPPALNTFDPNDDQASKELSYSVTKLTSADEGTIDLTLPEQKVNAPSGNWGASAAYPGFLFVDDYIASVLVQVADVETATDEQSGEETTTYVYDYSTLTPVTDAVSVKEGGGYACGVPDEATAEQYGWDYAEICEAFGPEPTGELVNNNGKADAEYNRARMADWQDEYQIDLSGIEMPEITDSDSDEVQAGDWVILSSFYRGTGQSITGGPIMANRVFISSYYNEAGTSCVTDYWDQMLENDPELKELMEANPGYIFEDSIESSSASSYWAAGLQNDAAEYEYGDILSIIAAGKYTGSGFGGTTLTEFFKWTGDDGLTDRIYEDYNSLLAETYVKYRVTGVTNWAEETLGWGFRGQTYQLPGLEISKAASVANVPECDNMSKGDGIRYQSGTENLTNRDFLTIEAMTGVTQEFVTMDDVLTELGQNYSDGVNRVILHGTPYSKTFNDYNHEWPGWLAFGYGSFGSSYTYREAYWDDFSTETGFMSRVQAVLQKGTAQIDLAVLIDKEHTFDFESGNRFQNLLDCGYSYNLVSESTIQADSATVADGVLAPDGPAYKALILDEITTFDVASMDKVLEYAQAGLPIIVYNSNISKVYGSNVADDAVLAEKYQELIAMDGVSVVSDLDGLKAAVEELGVVPYAQYDAAQLETTMYTDKATGANYYYMYNNANPENTGMIGNDQASLYKGEDKVIRDAQITLAGTGAVYRLDPHTGDITEVTTATANDDGTMTFTIPELYGGDAVIYCVTDNTEGFPEEIAAEKVTTTEGAPAAVDLSSETWNLLIHSYGPDETADDPSTSKITDVDFGAQNLIKWADIEATEEQLAELDVEDMKYVSGIGEYSITFTMPEDFDPDTMGAYLDLTYQKDQIGAVTINGTTLTFNNASDRCDLGGYLVSGENTLTIKLSTTLYARMYATNSGYAGTEFGMGSGFMAAVEEGLFANGLMTAVITPYIIL